MSPKIFVRLCEEAVKKSKRQKEAKSLIFAAMALVDANNTKDLIKKNKGTNEK